jgi:hypothetical protein
MYISFLILTVLVLVLIGLLKRTDYILWKNNFSSFPLEKFRDICGHVPLKVGDFTLNGTSDLYSADERHIYLKDWFDTRNDLSHGNRQSRLVFDKDSNNKIALFIKHWIGTLNLPIKFMERYHEHGDHCEFTLRISRGKWDYPVHFDAVDNFTFILHGNRNVELNGTFIELKPCDLLYFKAGVDHHFWCDNELNLVLNICFPTNDPKIRKHFSEVYPERVSELNLGKDNI